MTAETDSEVSVLIVEDEVELAEMYGAYLPDTYDVTIANGGEEALELVDSSFDVVLLDRRMPRISGSEVLAHIEQEGVECHVAMVTAVDPDFDIIDLRIDDYLVKPITRDELLETVERLVTLEEYNELVQELTAKKLKRNVLQVEKPRSELQESTEFEQLTAEIAEIEAELDALADDLDVEDVDEIDQRF